MASKNDIIYDLLKNYVKAWGEVNGYTWEGAKVYKDKRKIIVDKEVEVRNKSGVNLQQEKDITESELQEILQKYFKTNGINNLWASKPFPSEPVKIEIKDHSSDIYSLDEINNKIKKPLKDQIESLRLKLDQYEQERDTNSPQQLFDELLSELKERNEEVYKLFSDVLNNDKKKTIIPVLINIQYLLEIKKIEKESKSVKNVFEPHREKEIAQLLSWYLMKADKDGSLEYTQVKKIIKYINNDVLETYNIIDEDYSGSDFTFNQKNMISIGKEDNIGSVLYEYLSLPITVKKTTGAHKIKPALVKDK